MKKTLAAFMLTGASSLALAGGSVDLGLTQHSVRVEHDATRVGTGAHFTVGGHYNEQKGYMISGGFNAVDQNANASQEMLGGLGMKAYSIKVDEDPAPFRFAIGVGGFVRWNPDQANGLGVEGQLYYAPGVLSFAELTGFSEAQIRLTYKALPQARIFVGWSDVRATYNQAEIDNFEKSEIIIDSSIMLGFRMNY